MLYLKYASFIAGLDAMLHVRVGPSSNNATPNFQTFLFHLKRAKGVNEAPLFSLIPSENNFLCHVNRQGFSDHWREFEASI